MNNFSLNTAAGRLKIYHDLDQLLRDQIPTNIIASGPLLIPKYKENFSWTSTAALTVPETTSAIVEHHNLLCPENMDAFKKDRFFHYFLNKDVSFYVKEADLGSVQKLACELATKSNIQHPAFIEFEHHGKTYFLILGQETFQHYETADHKPGELILFNDNNWIVGCSEKPLDLIKKALQDQRYFV